MTPTTALIPHHNGRLRRRAATAPEHGTAAASAFAWLTDLASEISTTATPSLMFVDGEPVVVDTSDYQIRGADAVVLQHDGTLAIDCVEYRAPREEAPFHEFDGRRGWGAWRQSSLPGASAERPGVTIVGRVIARAGQRLRAA